MIDSNFQKSGEITVIEDKTIRKTPDNAMATFLPIEELNICFI